MNVLILGSGFGLYGYLPAVYSFSKRIYLNEKYEKIFKNKKKLSKFKKKIEWFSRISDLEKKIDITIIAIRPNEQIKFLKKLISLKKRYKHFFLEKPIAKSPNQSVQLLKFLKKNKIRYSFGFIFKFLKWYKVLKTKKKNKRINLIWHIDRKKLNDNWKYDYKQGGGLLRYYGIHIIELIFNLRFDYIKKNLITKNSWKSEFVDKNKNNIVIDLKFSKKNKFSLTLNKSKILDAKNPFFKVIKPGLIDPRVKILKNILEGI